MPSQISVETLSDTASAARDPLTGFGTRRTLMADLALALAPDSPSAALVVFDLGGLDDYAELYGRLEGSNLLVRVARRLEDALGPGTSFYRPRDDEFAALMQAAVPAVDSLLASAVVELTDRFAQFDLTLAFGRTTLPDEASDPLEALLLADERLLVSARGRRARERRSSPREQGRE